MLVPLRFRERTINAKGIPELGFVHCFLPFENHKKLNSLEVHRFSRKVIHRSFLGNNEDRAKNHYNNILILSKIFGPPVLGFFAEPIENILSRGSLPLAGSSTGL